MMGFAVMGAYLEYIQITSKIENIVGLTYYLRRIGGDKRNCQVYLSLFVKGIIMLCQSRINLDGL